MTLAGRYAYAGREWVIERVRSIIGREVLDTVHNHHNYAWRDRHGDRELWVVRKGATPAFPGQRGFVGGSMGDDAVILTTAAAPGLFITCYHWSPRPVRIPSTPAALICQMTSMPGALSLRQRTGSTAIREA